MSSTSDGELYICSAQSNYAAAAAFRLNLIRLHSCQFDAIALSRTSSIDAQICRAPFGQRENLMPCKIRSLPLFISPTKFSWCSKSSHGFSFSFRVQHIKPMSVAFNILESFFLFFTFLPTGKLGN